MPRIALPADRSFEGAVSNGKSRRYHEIDLDLKGKYAMQSFPPLLHS
jgi:hypothetical protein